MTTWALPAELTIYTAADTHGRWLAALAAGADPGTAGGGAPGGTADDPLARIDATAVEQVDGAGLQLLLSLVRTLADRGLAVRVEGAPPALRAAAAALGLDGLLDGAVA